MNTGWLFSLPSRLIYSSSETSLRKEKKWCWWLQSITLSPDCCLSLYRRGMEVASLVCFFLFLFLFIALTVSRKSIPMSLLSFHLARDVIISLLQIAVLTFRRFIPYMNYCTIQDFCTHNHLKHSWSVYSYYPGQGPQTGTTAQSKVIYLNIRL